MTGAEGNSCIFAMVFALPSRDESDSSLEREGFCDSQKGLSYCTGIVGSEGSVDISTEYNERFVPNAVDSLESGCSPEHRFSGKHELSSMESPPQSALAESMLQGCGVIDESWFCGFLDGG